MKYLLLFLNWLKAALAKEAVVTVFCILMAVFLSWVMNILILRKFPTIMEELAAEDVSNLEYWIFLFISILVAIYGIRIAESVIKTVLLKKEDSKT